MYLARGLGRFSADRNGPRANLLHANGEEGLKAQELIPGAHHAVTAWLSQPHAFEKPGASAPGFFFGQILKSIPFRAHHFDLQASYTPKRTLAFNVTFTEWQTAITD